MVRKEELSQLKGVCRHERSNSEMACVVLIVEDFEPFRRFVCSTLQQNPNFHIAEASDGLEALRKIEELQPDLILLDLNLPNLNGLQVCRCARQLGPMAKVLFMSQDFSADLVEEAFRVAAQGYIHKIHILRDLSPAIRAVLKGKRFVSSGLHPLTSILCHYGHPNDSRLRSQESFSPDNRTVSLQENERLFS